MSRTVLDIRKQIEGRSIRLTNFLDEETRQFEKEFRTVPGIELTHSQSQLWLENSKREFLLFQVRGSDGSPKTQIVVFIRRPARMPIFALGDAGRVSASVTPADELWAIQNLRTLCSAHTDLTTLRFQARRAEASDLAEFVKASTAAGFHRLKNPEEYLNTLRFNFPEGPDATLMKLSKKTRAKIRAASKCGELRVITDPKYISQCQYALNASFARTGSNAADFDFETVFAMAAKYPDRVRIVACFMPHRPDEVLAFVIGFRYGKAAEYVSAGSLYDAELRKSPFNYALLWELVKWSHENGAEWMDLGGITAGKEGDNCASISEFKRHLSEDEITIHHEAGVVFQPFKSLLLNFMLGTQSMIRQPSFRVATSLACILALFFVLSLPFTRVGTIESPAWKALRETTPTGHAPELAIVGDSRPHAGMSPALIQEVMLGEHLPVATAHNYAVNGTDVLHHFSFATHGLLNLKKPPQVLIWAPNPLSFNSVRQSNHLEQLLAKDIVPFYKAGAPREMLLDLATMAVYPSYRHRPAVRSKIFDYYGDIAGQKTIPVQKKILKLQFEEEPTSRKYIPFPDGFEPFEVLAWDDRFSRGAKAYEGHYSELKLSDWHFEVARQLLTEARKAGTLVIVVEMPVSPSFQKTLAKTAPHVKWREQMEKVAAAEGAIFWNHSEFFQDDHQFGDPGHLARPAAEEYSRKLGKLLADDPKIREVLKQVTAQRQIGGSNAF